MVALYNYIAVAALIFAGLSLSAKDREKSQKAFLRGLFIVLCFFTIFRYENPGTDYANYIVSFYKSKHFSFMDALLMYEPGYHLFQKVLSTLFDNGQIFHIVTGIFINFSFFRFIKKHSLMPVLSALLFVFFGTYFAAHNATRQFIAVAICLFAYDYLLEKRFVPFAALVLLASTFHLSAIAVLPLYFLCKTNYNANTLSVYIIFTQVCCVLCTTILGVIQKFFYSKYGADSYGMYGSSELNLIKPIIYFLLLIICIYVCERKTSSYIRPPEENMTLHLVSLYSLLAISAVLYSVNLGRINWYFSVGQILFLPQFVTNYFKKEERAVAVCLVLFFAFAFFLVNNYVGNLSPTPYDFFWNHSQYTGGY